MTQGENRKHRTSPLDSFRFAVRGFIAALLRERNLYLSWCVFLAVVWAAVYFQLTGGMLLAVLICCALVISSELVNTAFEVLVDLVSPDWNEQAGLVKDIAAGAVWFTALVSGIIGLIVFIPRLLRVGDYWPHAGSARAFSLLGLAVVLLVLGIVPAIAKSRRHG